MVRSSTGKFDAFSSNGVDFNGHVFVQAFGVYLLQLDYIPASGFENWRDRRDWEHWHDEIERGPSPHELAAFTEGAAIARRVRAPLFNK